MLASALSELLAAAVLSRLVAADLLPASPARLLANDVSTADLPADIDVFLHGSAAAACLAVAQLLLVTRLRRPRLHLLRPAAADAGH